MQSSRLPARRATHRPGCCAFGLAIASFALTIPAAASYRIESLYSDQSGFDQNIELREDSADGKITPLAGSIITVRHGNIVKRYVIPSDPPAGFPAGGTLLVSTIEDIFLCWSLLFCGVAAAMNEAALRIATSRIPTPLVVLAYLAVTTFGMFDVLPLTAAALARTGVAPFC